MESCKEKSTLVMPKWVIGDLDSATKDTLAILKEHGTEIIYSADPNTNDMEKALLHLGSSLDRESTREKLVVWPGVSRIDHMM